VNPAVRAAGAVLDRALTARDRLAGPRPGFTLLGWHRVDGAPGGLSTSPEEFRRHLDLLEEWGATVVDLDTAVADPPPRAVVLTFDDGYASVADTAWPLLKVRGWPALLYAVAGYLDGGERFPWDERAPGDTARLLDARGLADLAADGMAVGSHTVTHRWLPHLPPGVVRDEVRTSRERLQDLLQRDVTTFSYPMGGWDAGVRRAIAGAGYATAVTVDRGRNTAATDRLALRRAFAPRDPADLRRVLSGAYTFLRPLDRWRTRSGPAWQE
jgi:peptidoglycan/xylan/chitin deacetylase (PgdA/CDA1 family)